MNRVRGALMLIAACVAFWQAWRLHHGHSAWLAVGLGVLALALGAWHLTRKPSQPRI
jgi:drug/metabolite transporter superfamily protein YnfA